MQFKNVCYAILISKVNISCSFKMFTYFSEYQILKWLLSIVSYRSLAIVLQKFLLLTCITQIYVPVTWIIWQNKWYCKSKEHKTKHLKPLAGTWYVLSIPHNADVENPHLHRYILDHWLVSSPLHCGLRYRIWSWKYQKHCVNLLFLFLHVIFGLLYIYLILFFYQNSHFLSF